MIGPQIGSKTMGKSRYTKKNKITVKNQSKVHRMSHNIYYLQ